MIIFGIDIGGTTIKLGVFDETGKLLEQWAIPTNPNRVLEETAQSVLQYLKKNHINEAEVYGVGIGIPGIVKQDIAISCVNLSWRDVKVKEEFIKALGFTTKVYVFNDANIAAYGEAFAGDKIFDSVVFITLGTGVGGGIVFQQEIQEGAFGLGGELGHIQMDDIYNFECCCGKKGCLETLASATGIVRLAKHLASDYPTCMKIDDKLTAKDVIDYARQEDTLAVKALNVACGALAKAMANIAVIINPSAFIIGGGLSNAGDFLLEKIKMEFLRYSIREAQGTRIMLAKLKNDAGIYGACQYILNKKNEVEKNGKC